MRLTYSIADQDWRNAKSLGIYNFSMGLLKALAARQDLSLHLMANSNSTLKDIDLHSTTISRHDLPINCKAGRILWDQIEVYRQTKQKKADWLLLPKGFASFIHKCPAYLAVYMHDIITVIYPKRYPEYAKQFSDPYFSLTCKRTLEFANVVFTNTDFTRTEIERWAAEQEICCPPVIVAGYGFEKPLPQSAGLSRNHILIELRNTPHKRSDLAVSYLHRWCKDQAFTGQVLCAGSLPEGLKIPAEPNWQFIGRIHPDEYRKLMEKARSLVFFSEYEGFGMPPVEAILSGACPVFSAIPPTLEAMRGTGYSFSNDSYESFATAMDKAIITPQSLIQSWQTELIAAHNWKSVSSRIVETLRSLSK